MPKPNNARAVVFFFIFLAASAISPAVLSQDILERYIRAGLDSNLALRQKSYDWERARLDLRRAQALFYPQAGFNAQYTLAQGGRTQDIPVGDLLNSVYSTLNELTASNKFPQVANQSVKFLPNDFQDTKMEISMPLIDPDLRYNRQVKQELVNTQQAGFDIYRRELVRQIRQAYYQYLQVRKAVEIYDNALMTVRENLRVSEDFVKNGMATREIVLRARTQVSQTEASREEASNNLQNAGAYFNFLLNRPLETPLLIDSFLLNEPAQPEATAGPSSGSTAGIQYLSVDLTAPPSGREELAQLKSTQRIMETNLKSSRAYLVPRLNTFYDVGFQGFGYHFSSDQFYQLAGLQLQWNLFKGGDNKYKIRQAHIDIEALRDQYLDLGRQLTLQVQTALNNYRSACRTVPSLSEEVVSARETYRLAEKRFKEGQALQIELIDARTRMTDAELRYSLGRLAVLDREAELERATASYKF
ncbi:MAG: TolC family protein [Puia sp.]|nr:TolC family protein [Puia sp.]